MDIYKALSIAENKEKEYIAISAGETSNWFKFHMVLRESKEGIGNGCSLVVSKKSGECGWKPMFISGDEDYNYGFIKIYDEEELNAIRGK